MKYRLSLETILQDEVIVEAKSFFEAKNKAIKEYSPDLLTVHNISDLKIDTIELAPYCLVVQDEKPRGLSYKLQYRARMIVYPDPKSKEHFIVIKNAVSSRKRLTAHEISYIEDLQMLMVNKIGGLESYLNSDRKVED